MEKPIALAINLLILSFSLQSQVKKKSMAIPKRPTAPNLTALKRSFSIDYILKLLGRFDKVKRFSE